MISFLQFMSDKYMWLCWLLYPWKRALKKRERKRQLEYSNRKFVSQIECKISLLFVYGKMHFTKLMVECLIDESTSCDQCERSNIIADWTRCAMCRRPIKTAPLAFALCRQKPIDSNHLPEFWFFVSFRLEAMRGCVYCTQWEIFSSCIRSYY